MHRNRGYHKYAVEIDRRCRTSRSGSNRRQQTTSPSHYSQVDATTWNNAIHTTSTPIYDLAIGGQFPAATSVAPHRRHRLRGTENATTSRLQTSRRPARRAGAPNVAQGRPATAFASESALFGAGNVTDTDTADPVVQRVQRPAVGPGDTGRRTTLKPRQPQWEASDDRATRSRPRRRYELGNGRTKTAQPSEHTDLAATAPPYVRSTDRPDSRSYDTRCRPERCGATRRRQQPLPRSPTQNLLSAGAPGYASSTENGSFTAPNAVDGKHRAHGGPARSGPQWP